MDGLQMKSGVCFLPHGVNRDYAKTETSLACIRGVEQPPPTPRPHPKKEETPILIYLYKTKNTSQTK